MGHYIFTVLSLLLFGCTGFIAQGTVDRGIVSYDKDPTISDITTILTRTSRIVHEYDLVMEVSSLLITPTWRHIYKQQQRPNHRSFFQSHDDQKPLLFQDMMIAVRTHDYRDNILDKTDKSHWTMTLSDNQNNLLYSTAIIPAKQPLKNMKQYFPYLTPFHKVYLVRFPKELSPQTKQITFRIFKDHQQIEHQWIFP